MIYNIYLKSIKKWKDILKRIQHGWDLGQIHDYAFSPCSFCREYKNCDRCIISEDICSMNGANGLVGELYGNSNLFSRKKYTKITKKIIKALKKEMKKYRANIRR